MLYFVRHGESEANIRGVFAGQRDNSDLTPKGIEQAKKAGQELKAEGITIDQIVASPLVRTVKTATIIAEEIGYPVSQISTDERLLEYDPGTLSGNVSEDVSSIVLTSSEGAENPLDFKLRVESAANEYYQYDGNVLIVSHAGFGRMLEIIRQDGDPALFFDVAPPPNAKVIKVHWHVSEDIF